MKRPAVAAYYIVSRKITGKDYCRIVYLQLFTEFLPSIFVFIVFLE